MKKLPRYLKNKYVISGLVFFFWMLLFHDVDLFYMYKLRAELSDLEERLEYCNEQTALASEALFDLNTNTRSLEKYAREQYYMKRENEDLFVFDDQTLK